MRTEKEIRKMLIDLNDDLIELNDIDFPDIDTRLQILKIACNIDTLVWVLGEK